MTNFFTQFVLSQASDNTTSRNIGGTDAWAVPHLKFWGDRPPVPAHDRLQSKIQEQQCNDNCNRIGVTRNFMCSKVTSKTTSVIKMIIELTAVCREISYIGSSVSFAKNG